MQLEIEQKFPIADRDAFVERLGELSAAHLGTVEQSDTYYEHPSRDFRTTGEALRIRRSGSDAVVTYKGPKLGTQVKTRREIELPLSEPQSWSELLEILGFSSVATVTKHRDRYRVTRPPFELEVTIDRVEGVGEFAEVEIVADESQCDAARTAVVQLATELGLSELEPRSYLRMFLESTGDA